MSLAACARGARASWMVVLILAVGSRCGAATQSRPSGIVHGYKFDRARLERHLQFLGGHGVDQVRVLGEVGSPGDDPQDTLSDRPIDPRWNDACPGSSSRPATCGTYDEVIAGFTDLAFDRYGLRVEWTVFGGTGFTPTPGSRVALLDRVLAMSKGREHKIMHFEVANEFYHNGFRGPEGLAEIRRLGRLRRQPAGAAAALVRDSWPSRLRPAAEPPRLGLDHREGAAVSREPSFAHPVHGRLLRRVRTRCPAGS